MLKAIETTEDGVTTKQDVGGPPAERVVALGCTLQRGWLWWVQAEDEADRDCSIEHTWIDETGQLRSDTELRQYGYNGNDLEPCTGEYLAYDEDLGYLVITGDAEPPVCVDGWAATLADDLDEGHVENDGCWTAVIVRVHGGGEYTTCGHL